MQYLVMYFLLIRLIVEEESCVKNTFIFSAHEMKKIARFALRYNICCVNKRCNLLLKLLLLVIIC